MNPVRLAWWRLLVAALVVSLAAAPVRAQSSFSNEQLDQMLAPIALYPDSLLSQVLMASTYPAEVAEAVQWSKANPNQKGDAAVKAVDAKGWDPSVSSLVAFPQALAMMGEKPEWVQSVGDAFLAQPEAVMDSVQRLRGRAQQAGTLQSNEQQKIIVEQAPQTTQTIIRIEPAQPQVVYVPVYNPTVVYGTWPYPSYPPYYWPTPGYAFGSALMSGIAFGTGIAITNALWGGFNWGRNDVNINVNRFNNINVNRQISANQNNVSWQHNSNNRRGVPYRDASSRQKYAGNAGAGADSRRDYRGQDANVAASREKAQAAMQNRGVDPAKGRQELRDNPQARQQAQSAVQNRDKVPTRDPSKAATKDYSRDNARATAQNMDRQNAQQAMQNRGGGDNAFKGVSNPGQAKQSIDRGASSRQAASRPAPQVGGGSTPKVGGGGTAPKMGGGAGGGARAGGGGGHGRVAR